MAQMKQRLALSNRDLKRSGRGSRRRQKMSVLLLRQGRNLSGSSCERLKKMLVLLLKQEQKQIGNRPRASGCGSRNTRNRKNDAKRLPKMRKGLLLN